MRRTPTEPTKQEILEHNLTHLPFRSWCPCCVAAKAKQWPHRKAAPKGDDEETVPSIHMDYWFMRDGEVDEKVTVLNINWSAWRCFSSDFLPLAVSLYQLMGLRSSNCFVTFK